MPTEKSEKSKAPKTCMVPSCKAVSTKYPDRIFFTVPEAKKHHWLELVGDDDESIEPNKRLFCCENHFSVRFVPSSITTVYYDCCILDVK